MPKLPRLDSAAAFWLFVLAALALLALNLDFALWEPWEPKNAQTAIEMVERGDFGRLYHLEGEYNYGRIHKLIQGWRGEINHYSVVVGGAVHVVDQLLWLTGGRVTEVACFGNGISSAGTTFRHDDMAAALLRFEDGVTATVTANFACMRPHGHGLVVCGTRATFVNDHPQGWLYTSRDPEWRRYQESGTPAARDRGCPQR